MTKINCCDDVFDALTAGPLQVGSQTADAIERHLSDCKSCRDLAHALRPARHLLHETLPDDQHQDLPLFLTQDDMVESIMARVNEIDPHVGNSPAKWTPPSFLTGIFVAGMLLLLVCANPWLGNQASLAKGPSDLDGWNLPPACRTAVFDRSIHQIGWTGSPTDISSRTEMQRDSGTQPLGDGTTAPAASRLSSSATEPHSYQCCTICHHAVKGTESQIVDPAMLVAACNACH